MENLLPDTLTNEEVQVEEATVVSPELTLDIPDSDLLSVINQKISDSTIEYQKKKIPERQKSNENMWRGNHHEGIDYYAYQIPYTNNIIHRDTETRIALAAGRMPDIIVIPDKLNDTQAAMDAKDYENYLAGKVNSDTTKRLIKNVLRDREIKLIGIIKVRWDKNRGENGDYVFERLRSQDVVFDHSATIPEDGYTSDNMEYISEWIEEPLSLVLAKFPRKSQELAAIHGIKDISRTGAKKLASKIKYRETWATWYNKEGQRMEVVFWHYRTIVLEKAKSPCWDWSDEGRNHFDMPRKPYMFTSYENLGNGPHDDTSAIEQTTDMQRNINKRGMQITEITDRTVPKLVISGTAMTKEEAEKLTPDPNENVFLDASAGNDATKSITSISALPPHPSLLQDMGNNIQQIDAHFSTHSITRGEGSNNDESGVAKQITREGDLSIADDIVQIVVERLVEEMANWATQLGMIHYYDPNADKKITDSGYDFDFKPWTLKKPGKDGDFEQVNMTREKIRKGINVMVKSSMVDKPTMRSLIMQLGQEKGIDIYSLYDALDLPNPKELTERFLKFTRGGGENGDGFAAYAQLLGIDLGAPPSQPGVPAPPGGQPGQPPQSPQPAAPGQATDEQQAMKDIQMIISGQEPSAPQQVSNQYAQVFAAFGKSPNFDKIPDDAKQAFLKYVDQLHQLVDQQGAPSLQ